MRNTARLFAMVNTAVSDAIIAGFDAKYRHRSWRPRTAIPFADLDGNDDTVGDPTWRPLLSVNHPEYPSGHGFWSTALIGSVAAFFGTTEVPWTITTSKTAVPALVRTERTYTNLMELLNEIGNARVWAACTGASRSATARRLARRVAAHVQATQFRPAR